MKSNYVRRAEKFMREFYPYLKKAYSLEQAVMAFNREKSRKVSCASGMIRRCLIVSDYVVKWDYNSEAAHTYGGCKNEYKVYKTIQNSGYEYLFMPITPIEVHNRTYYVMPRIDSLAYDTIYEDNEDASIENYLSDEELDFIYDDLCLRDLHDENWGFLKGKVKIIDYAMCGI